ncbi:phosphotransferase family protein [Streptomyces sp. NPDC054786]
MAALPAARWPAPRPGTPRPFAQPPAPAPRAPHRAARLSPPSGSASCRRVQHCPFTQRSRLGCSDELLDAYAHLDFPLGQGLVHGDAYPGKTLRDGSAATLGDWDEAAIGPRETDLANTFQGVRFGRTPAQLRAFSDAYGYDLARQLAAALFDVEGECADDAFDTALRYAHVAGNAALGANVLAFWSAAAYNTGRLHDAANMASTGLTAVRGRATPRVGKPAGFRRVTRSHTNRTDPKDASASQGSELDLRTPPWTRWTHLDGSYDMCQVVPSAAPSTSTGTSSGPSIRCCRAF